MAFTAAVFDAIADRLAGRPEQIELFLESGGCFEQWCVWEGLAACREQGWRVQPQPSYADVGLLGSRERGDLLVIDPARDERVLIELALISDWTTNRWIASLKRDAGNLARVPRRGTAALQIIMAAALSARIDVNATWISWLAMTGLWEQPTELDRTLALGDSGQLIIRGW